MPSLYDITEPSKHYAFKTCTERLNHREIIFSYDIYHYRVHLKRSRSKYEEMYEYVYRIKPKEKHSNSEDFGTNAAFAMPQLFTFTTVMMTRIGSLCSQAEERLQTQLKFQRSASYRNSTSYFVRSQMNANQSLVIVFSFYTIYSTHIRRSPINKHNYYLIFMTYHRIASQIHIRFHDRFNCWI